MKNSAPRLPTNPYESLNLGLGFIYLLRLASKFKLGRTANLRTRVKAINDDLKRRGKGRIEIEHYFVASHARQRERQFHDYFSDARVESETATYSHSRPNQGSRHMQSEWYQFNESEVEYIKSFGDEVL